MLYESSNLSWKIQLSELNKEKYVGLKVFFEMTLLSNARGGLSHFFDGSKIQVLNGQEKFKFLTAEKNSNFQNNKI